MKTSLAIASVSPETDGSAALAFSPVQPPQEGPAGRALVLAELRKKIAEIAPPRPLPIGLPSGVPELEAATGGWPRPGVALIRGSIGSGRLSVVLPVLSRLTCSGRRVAIVDPGGLLYPPGLPDVLLDNILLVKPGATRVLWTVEQLARCDAIPLVIVLDPPALGRAGARLLHAAEAGNNAIIVVSEIEHPYVPFAVHLKTGRPGQVCLLRGGHGPKGAGSGRWLALPPPSPSALSRRAFPFEAGTVKPSPFAAD